MFPSYFIGFLLFLFSNFLNGQSLLLDPIENVEEDMNELSLPEEERLFVIPAITLNITSLATALPIFLALATSVASLLATVALAAVVFSIFGKYKYDGYGSYSGYGTGGAYNSYSSSYRSIFDPNMIDWEKHSLVDIISAGEEIWNKFDPTDASCQKRLICEIHENSSNIGFAAEKIVDIFGYLSYSKVMTLPEELQAFIDDLLNAASKGLSEVEECGLLFPDCKFSLKKIVAKYASKNS